MHKLNHIRQVALMCPHVMIRYCHLANTMEPLRLGEEKKKKEELQTDRQADRQTTLLGR